MKLAIHSPSAAVTRSLGAIAMACGATLDQDAALALHHTGTLLRLQEGEALLQQWSLPVRPSAIARHLGQPQTAHAALLDGWQFDATARLLIGNETTQPLTEKEAVLLQLLLQHYPAPCPRAMLLKEGWNMQPDIETHTLETHIYRLRQKLAELSPKPCDITTADSAYLLTLEPTA